MITKSIKYLFMAGTVCCGLALVGCSDTWDDHYESTVAGAREGSLWDAIKQNPELSNFSSVLEATGYDQVLSSSQVFSVFAPTNSAFSAEEANFLIQQYNDERGKVSRDDNSTVKEFVQNHIALYNYSVSSASNDTITLMNGKYAVLTPGHINSSPFTQTNQLYENGVLYVLGEQVPFSTTVFESFRKAEGLDSVYSFLYNPMFYRKDFQAESSVEGGLDSLGRTVYLDSVFVQRNELYSLLSARLNAEDSTYWMIAPTNEAWAKMVEEYTPYFNYADNVENFVTQPATLMSTRDSVIYTNTRLAILQGTAFSKTVNEKFLSRLTTQANPIDSVFSTEAPTNYNYREAYWNANFNYYQYFNPLGERGVFNEPDSIPCSNGMVMRVNDWKLDKLQTFHRWIIVDAEVTRNLKEIGRTADSRGDSVNLATATRRAVLNDDFKGKVWGNAYLELNATTVNRYNVTFNISNVLSNIGYDIYVVTTTPLANDSNATEAQRLPTIFNCKIKHANQEGRLETEELQRTISTTGVGVEYLLMAEDYKFPVCTYGINESEPTTQLFIESRVSNSQESRGTHTKTICIDCILLVPHGTLQLIDELPEDPSLPASYWGQPAVLMTPHGDNRWQYIKLR